MGAMYWHRRRSVAVVPSFRGGASIFYRRVASVKRHPGEFSGDRLPFFSSFHPIPAVSLPNLSSQLHMITRSDAATLPPPASLLPCLHVVADVDAISTVRRLFSTTDAISPADPSFSDQKLKTPIACVKRESNEASNSIIRGFNKRIILQIWWMGCFSSRYLLSQGSILSAPLIFRYIPTTHFFETTTLFVANTARFLTRLFADIVVRGYGGYTTRWALFLLHHIFPLHTCFVLMLTHLTPKSTQQCKEQIPGYSLGRLQAKTAEVEVVGSEGYKGKTVVDEEVDKEIAQKIDNELRQNASREIEK
ncbi:hypothetical protein LXL04_039372 [Taraxacum kok-saghyz]